MIFRQLYDVESSTYTYLLSCKRTGVAVLIDPVFEQHTRDMALIRELELDLRYVIDTHVHADHVTGAWLMKHAFGAEIVLSRRYEAQGVDRPVAHGDVLPFGDCALEVRATPGHTRGCLTYVTAGRDLAFTGDCLLIRGAGRTDFQGGDVRAMWRSIQEQIFSLPDECLIYPAHDYQGRTVTTVAEERRFNPRIGADAHEEDFVGYMENLGLAHPKLLDIAVPANLRCGRPADERDPSEVDWGPVHVNFAGIPEVQAEWVAQNLARICVIDVRNADELIGPLGAIDGSLLLPLDQLRSRLSELPRDRPIVAVCQSGKRSGMAALILQKAGFEQVANVSGGLIQWQRLALPIARP